MSTPAFPREEIENVAGRILVMMGERLHPTTIPRYAFADMETIRGLMKTVWTASEIARELTDMYKNDSVDTQRVVLGDTWVDKQDLRKKMISVALRVLVKEWKRVEKTERGYELS